MQNGQLIARAFLDDSVELVDQSCIKIRNCLSQLSDEQVWWRARPESNSIGNLVLHVCGNLRQWTAAGLLHQPDNRNRDEEFQSESGWSCQQLQNFLDSESAECKTIIGSLAAETLLKTFTIQGFEVTGLQAVNHTVTHFVGHTHQIIYICRSILGADYRFAWSAEDGRDRLPI